MDKIQIYRPDAPKRGPHMSIDQWEAFRPILTDLHLQGLTRDELLLRAQKLEGFGSSISALNRKLEKWGLVKKYARKSTSRYSRRTTPAVSTVDQCDSASASGSVGRSDPTRIAAGTESRNSTSNDDNGSYSPTSSISVQARRHSRVSNVSLKRLQSIIESWSRDASYEENLETYMYPKNTGYPELQNLSETFNTHFCRATVERIIHLDHDMSQVAPWLELFEKRGPAVLAVLSVAHSYSHCTDLSHDEKYHVGLWLEHEIPSVRSPDRQDGSTLPLPSDIPMAITLTTARNKLLDLIDRDDFCSNASDKEIVRDYLQNTSTDRLAEGAIMTPDIEHKKPSTQIYTEDTPTVKETISRNHTQHDYSSSTVTLVNHDLSLLELVDTACSEAETLIDKLDQDSARLYALPSISLESLISNEPPPTPQHTTNEVMMKRRRSDLTSYCSSLLSRSSIESFVQLAKRIKRDPAFRLSSVSVVSLLSQLSKGSSNQFSDVTGLRSEMEVDSMLYEISAYPIG